MKNMDFSDSALFVIASALYLNIYVKEGGNIYEIFWLVLLILAIVVFISKFIRK